MALGNELFEGLARLARGVPRVDLGDVTRIGTPARLDALQQMLPVPQAPRPMTLGEGLVAGRGFKPREGDLDVNDTLRRLEYNEDTQTEYLNMLMSDDIEEQMRTREYDIMREYMDRYFPEDEYDWSSPAMGLERAFAKATPEYLTANEVPEGNMKEFYGMLADDIDAARTKAWEEGDYFPYFEGVESFDDVQDAYAALDEVGTMLKKLPEDNPLRKVIGRIPSSADYFNDVGTVINNLEALRTLQAEGVNRDVITRVLNNVELTRLFQLDKNVPESFQKLTPSQAEAFVRALPSISIYSSKRSKGAPIVSPVKFLKQAADIDDEVLRDTYLGILPEWEGTPEEALETARMLIDLGD